MYGRKERLIIAAAVIVLVLGSSSMFYVHATEMEPTNENSIDVAGTTVSVDNLFAALEEKTIENTFTGKSYSGISLDALVMYVGVVTAEQVFYDIIAADGYTKTVTWENISSW